MTVENTNSKNIFIGDGATSAFSYTFRIFAAADLEVVINDLITDTTLVLTTNYTVTGVGSKAGGLVTLLGPLAPLTSLHTITIRRVLPLTQDTDLRNQGAYLPEVVEDALDRLLMQIQQQGSNELINIKLPATEIGTAAKTTLPSVANRLSKVFGWNAAGEIIAVATVPTSGVTATAYIETLLDDTTSVIARATLEISDELSPASVGVNQDNFTGGTSTSDHTLVRLTVSAPVDFTGFAGGVVGRKMTLVNLSASVITLKHQDGGSLAANRIIVTGAADLALSQNESATLEYDNTISRWRVIAAPLIGTAQIENDAVTDAKLRDDAAVDTNRAVTTDHIRDLAVTEAKIGALAVTSGKIGALAVTVGKIGALAVDTAEMVDDSVSLVKIKKTLEVNITFNTTIGAAGTEHQQTIETVSLTTVDHVYLISVTPEASGDAQRDRISVRVGASSLSPRETQLIIKIEEKNSGGGETFRIRVHKLVL